MENCIKFIKELKNELRKNEESIHVLESGLNFQHSSLKFLFKLVSIWPQNDNGLVGTFISHETIEECKNLAKMYCNAAALIQDRIMDVQKFVIKFLQFCDELNDDVLPLFLTKNEKTDLQEFNSFLSQFNEQICINVQFYNQFIENFN